MIEIRETDEYSRWFSRLKDRGVRVRILTRIRRLSLGNPGDVKPVGEGVSELRIDYGRDIGSITSSEAVCWRFCLQVAISVLRREISAKR